MEEYGHYWIASSNDDKWSKVAKWLKRLAPDVTKAVFFDGSKPKLKILETFLKDMIDGHGLQQIQVNDKSDENIPNIVIRRGGGEDVELVDLIFNFEEPVDADTYLRRVAHAGSLRTNGLVITFVSDQ